MSISRQQYQQQLAAAAAAKSKRAYVLVPSALLICLLLYKAWGVVLLVTCALVLVSHTCYSLLYKDCLFDPRSLLLIKYVGELILELIVILKLLTITGWSTIKHTNQLVKRWLEQRNETWKLANREDEDTIEMNGRRSSYRLSTSGTEFTNKASPINTGSYQSFALNGSCDAARTSTPIAKGVGPHWRKDLKPNGSIGIFVDSPMPKKPSSLANENRYSNVTSRGDTAKYSQMPSWGSTSSPKIREKGHGVKTVQTVAGPLLASTRYNVDPKVYIDINSPGITSRLSKYATEAGNKLTHQPQYGTGQFPRVNLNATPMPVLSPKVSRSILPVTVRVAPPESNYPSVETQNQQERLKLYSGSSLELNDPKPSTSVSQVLKEISLKRHASREDIMLDLVKKQRTERISEGQLESLEEMMQKRAREDSSLASDEDDLPSQSKMQRPLKRQKASSCHDILNSLSSSASILSGVKRKATDLSQCNTEKHFKLASQSPSTSFSLTTSASIEESPKSKRQLNVQVPTTNNISTESTKLKQKSTNLELISTESPKNNKSQFKKSIDSPKKLESKPVSPVIKKAEKLTDKLFMKPEPQNVDKIKSLQSDSVESKFKTNDKDEIRKEDIVNMRTNSMRQRLQSMFDAISGKTTSKIDPDLVIQADELNTPSETSAFTSLTSTTSTTTVNTSPITTNIVPILKSDVEVKSPIRKTVTFNLPTSSATSDSQTSSTTTTNTNTDSKPTPTFSFNAPTTSASTGFNFSSNNTAASTTSATTKPSTTTGFTVSFRGTTTTATTTATSPVSSSASSPVSNMANTSAVLSFGNANVNSSTKTSIEQPPSSNLGKISNEKKESGFSFGASASTAAPTSTTAPPAFGSSNSTLMFSAGSSVTPATTSRVTVTTASSETQKPAISFSFGASTPAATTASNSGFSFGGTGTTTSAFSAPTKPASEAFAAPNNTQVSNPPSFGTTGNTTGFGALTTKTAPSAFGTPSSSVGFGSSVTTTSSTFGSTASGFGSSTTQNTVSFGNANTTAPPAYGTSTTTSAMSFGNPSTTTTPAFGISSPANPSTFGSVTKSSLFGNSATTAPSLFSNSTTTTASSSMFNAPTTNTTASIFGSQNKQETTGFGSVASKPNIASSTPSLFNAPTTSTSKQPTITSMFSAPGGSSSSKQPTITSMFGKTNSQATPTTTAPPAFGSTASSSIFSGSNSTNASTASPIFGGTSSSSTIPSATNNSSIFGQSKPLTNSGFGSPAPTFGSAPGSSAFSAPTSNAFSVGGTSTSKLPTFDIIKSGNSPAFGAHTSNQSTTPSIFGSNTGFGSTTAAPPAYGASTGTSFGAASTTQQTTSPFSVPATTAASSASSLFGNAASNSTSSSFSFSGNQASQQQQQPTSSFSFGGSTGNSGSNVFQFGGASNAAKPASSGFNFSAPTGGPTINFSGSTQQPPAFNAPAPAGNMFSIGSGGSSTPRSRSARPTRRQR
ncbi:mucin-5AC-like [Trichogramma pretiosum]|uniref:mucin-5AC-like n=1 Tax=Trichogramma pretiosum TaxID=7493 RepID=UPI000C71AF26|nr:mucin-5AC-like [Trichogramma pretiosum]